MLIRFKFANFLSFKDETTLLLTSHSRIRHPEGHAVEVGGKPKVLSFAALYGDNAAGKSNLLSAISFFRKALLFPAGMSNGSFAFKGNESTPTSMEMIFASEGMIYQYGFSLLRDSKTGRIDILEEYLNLLSGPGHRRSRLYAKEKGINFHYFGDAAYRKKLKLLIERYEQFDSNAYGSLFLSFSSRPENMIAGSKASETLSEVFHYLADSIIVINSSSFNVRFLDKADIKWIEKCVLSFDRGLTGMSFKAVSRDHVLKFISIRSLTDVEDHLRYGRASRAILNSGASNFFIVALDQGGSVDYEVIVLKHRYSDDEFCFEEESESTRRIIILMSALYACRKDATFFIDEIERNMHPSSVNRLYRFLEKQANENGHQFVFSTNCVVFMKDCLERDEIYFVDKDRYGRSILYPLTDFQTRSDSSLPKAFLNGEFRKFPKDEA